MGKIFKYYDESKIEHLKKVKPISAKELSWFELWPQWIRVSMKGVAIGVLIAIQFFAAILLYQIYFPNEIYPYTYNDWNTWADEFEKKGGLNTLSFDDTNTAIVKVDWFYENDIIIKDNSVVDKEGNQCNGYVIVEKINNTYQYNFDHLCDQIDY